MKKLICLTAAALALAILSPQAQAAKEKPIRISMSSQYMDRHPIVQYVYKPWIEDIKKRTNGRVVITYYNPNTLCPDGELLDTVIKGQVDIGSPINSRNGGRLPVNCLPNKIPMIASLATGSSLAYWDIYNSTPEMQKEFTGIKILTLHTTATLQINTKDKPVETLDDLKGKRIIGASKDTMVCINALGLNGLMQPSPDIYLAMSRNMGDAVFYPVPPMRSFKINEATKFTTYGDLYIGTCWFGMNQAKWDSLPDDVKKVFEETSGEQMSRALGNALDRGEREDVEIMKKSGHQFSILSQAEKDKWFKLIEPAMKNAWLKEIENSNVADPEAMYQKAVETMKKYEAQYGRAAVATK